ncbi:MAG: hypothetical protein MN733_20590 [Nitrososphaera sp.]|nr:hypothetical protein [Nitrososphaera sp.]
MDFYTAYWWFYSHPAFSCKGQCAGDEGFFIALEFCVQKVDPVTRRIEDDQSRNTHPEIWLEAGPWLTAKEAGMDDLCKDEDSIYGFPSHDYNLDCGGDTFEEALIKMAGLVKENYGDYVSR